MANEIIFGLENVQKLHNQVTVVIAHHSPNQKVPGSNSTESHRLLTWIMLMWLVGHLDLIFIRLPWLTSSEWGCFPVSGPKLVVRQPNNWQPQHENFNFYLFLDFQVLGRVVNRWRGIYLLLFVIAMPERVYRHQVSVHQHLWLDFAYLFY